MLIGFRGQEDIFRELLQDQYSKCNKHQLQATQQSGRTSVFRFLQVTAGDELLQHFGLTKHSCRGLCEEHSCKQFSAQRETGVKFYLH